jgi:hypothetical protein
VGCCSYKIYRLFQTPHSFSVTIFTLGFRLFFYSAANKLDLLHSPGFMLTFASSIHNKQQQFPLVLSAQSDRGFFHYRRAAFSSMLKFWVGNILAKAAALRINLNIDGSPITSKSHTHPSHSRTSRLLTSSLSLGIPVPRPAHYLRGV